MSYLLDLEQLKTNREALVADLESAGAVVKGKTVKCPFHEDHRASGGIYQAENGHWLFKCQTCGVGGTILDVRAKIGGRTVQEVMREAVGKPMQQEKTISLEELRHWPNLVACYDEGYRNPRTGKIDMVVLRLKKGADKHFLQARPVGGDCFVFRAPDKPWPLYNRGEVSSAEKIVVVEGEKDVNNLRDLAGIVATTSPGGAKNAANADWSPLTGKTVYLWPDNDQPGLDYMRRVGELLLKLRPRPTISWIRPNTLILPPKGDASDYLAALPPDMTYNARGRAIWDILDAADLCGPASGLADRIHAIIANKYAEVVLPWRYLQQLTYALMPGTVTLLAGEGGAGKSYFLLQLLVHCHQQGTSVCVFELEEDREYWLHRVLVQLVGNFDIMKPDWIREHATEAISAWGQYQEYLDAFGGDCLFAADGQGMKVDAMAKWIEEQAAAGYRLISVDPITVAETSREPWNDANEFMKRVKAAARRWGASVILATHPVKGYHSEVPHLDSLAGGAAYARLAQNVLWLRRMPEPKALEIYADLGSECIQAQWLVHILKCRNGKGAGARVAFDWGDDAQFRELGVVKK